MDHKTAYAHHIAQAIRHKKAIAQEPKEEIEELPEDDGMGAFEEPEAPLDPKAARKERIKAILAR